MILVSSQSKCNFFFFCTYRSPITRPIQELTRRRILEKKKTPNILSTVFKVERLPQQDHFKVKGYKYKDNNQKQGRKSKVDD